MLIDYQTMILFIEPTKKNNDTMAFATFLNKHPCHPWQPTMVVNILAADSE